MHQEHNWTNPSFDHYPLLLTTLSTTETTVFFLGGVRKHECPQLSGPCEWRCGGLTSCAPEIPPKTLKPKTQNPKPKTLSATKPSKSFLGGTSSPCHLLVLCSRNVTKNYNSLRIGRKSEPFLIRQVIKYPGFTLWSPDWEIGTSPWPFRWMVHQN
jgi:hypothetical protein